MTLTTLRRLEWAGWDGFAEQPECPDCGALKRQEVHAPDCELDAAIREAERRETGERPVIRVGDIMVEAGRPYAVRNQRDADLCQQYARVIEAIYRDPLWRQEAPTP